jgi:hypothetical protein
MKRLTVQRLRELLAYDPETGVFTWLVTKSSRAVKGSVAGSINGEGYRQIQLDGAMYAAHHLAWFYVKGGWPTEQIDHRNCTRDDNRFTNLREASGNQNKRNTRISRNNTSGFKGVYFDKRSNRWRAYIHHERRQRYLGTFDTATEAHAAYYKAAVEIDPEFARAA